MPPDNELMDANSLLRELMQQEERKSELYANHLRLLFTLLYFSVLFGIRSEVPSHSFNAILTVALINLCFGIFAHFQLRKEPPPAWVRYLSNSIDIVLLTIVIYSFGSYRSFKTEAFLLYYLWIGLSTLRFSPRLTFVSGLLSIGGYLCIVILAIDSQSVVFGSITDEFTSEKVSGSNIVLRLVFLSVYVALAVYTASVFRMIASRAIKRKMLKAKNRRLRETLDKLRATQKALARKNRELAQLSEIDSLTQLYNRRKIDKLLMQALDSAALPDSSIALILLDIDHFKSFNDRYGHQTGDDIILAVAETLRASARANDSIGRWGGEEFIIVCQDTDAEMAQNVAERLRKTIAEGRFDDGKRVTCSFGITGFHDGDTAFSLLKRADEALYRSKQQGRNRVTCLCEDENGRAS